MRRADIPRQEFERRWELLHRTLLERGYDGVMVWSRGGGNALDEYADVLWIANHYPVFPLLRDQAPDWVGISSACVLSDLRSEPKLIVDFPDWRQDEVPVSDVRHSLDVPAQVATTVGEMGLTKARMALVAANSMHVGPYLRLIEQLPRAQLVPEDELVGRLRVVKSDWEIEVMRAAAAIGQESMERIMEVAMVPGNTEADAIAAGYELAIRRGAIPFDGYTSSGPNSQALAYGRLPSWTLRELRAGDFFSVDWSGILDGYFWDCSRTCVVGGNPTLGQMEVAEAAEAAVSAGIRTAVPGAACGEVFDAVRSQLIERRMVEADDGGTSGTSLESSGLHGHATGLMCESPWFVAGEGAPIESSAVYNVEVMAGRERDGWVKLEEEILITDDGTEKMMHMPSLFS